MTLLVKVIFGLAVIFGALAAAYFTVVHFTPSFGGGISKQEKQAFEKLENFNKGKFRNRRDVPKSLGFKETLKLSYKFFTTKVENGVPNSPLEIEAVAVSTLNAPEEWSCYL